MFSLHVTTTDLKISKIFFSLKNGKAPGHDGISNEHLKYAGKGACKHLCNIINHIIQFEYIPESFRLGHVIAVHKGKGKPVEDPANTEV